KMAAIGQLAAGLAHEIYNPLNVIAGFSEYLMGKTSGDDPRRQAFEDICRETARCQKLVGELLHFAKPKTSEKTSADLNALIRETLVLVQSQTKPKGIEVVERLDAALPLLEVDRDQIKQVLLNLFLNACQAMPQGGVLSVESVWSDGFARVTVEDTGPGLSPEAAKNLFNPFFTTKEEGTGLGLALSYAIVERHGGIIEAGNGRDGGALFTIKLQAGENGKFN
ncbi:MAG: histidine kinase, partial [Elusimicrobia bacterium]|nr:histidine kinase [Elusimicrobiota bacterium]